MVVLDSSVLITALPRMQRDLHVGLSSLQWTFNAYGIAFAAGIITAAALGDRFGRRRVFNCGVALFTVASAACALAPNAGELIAARTVQGLAGAVVLPLSLTILTTAFPAEKRGMIVGVYGGLAGLAVALGPVVGGVVTEGIDWHWIFWLNVPIGIVAALLGLRLLPESYGAPERLDLIGVGLVTAGAVALVWALTRANDVGWSSAETVAALAVGGVLLVAFLAWEARVGEPMVPLRLFAVREFAIGNLTTFLMSGAIFAAAYFVTQEFQFARGYSPLATGLRLLPFFATPMFISPLAGALSDRIGRRPIMVVGLTLQAIGFIWVAARGSLERELGRAHGRAARRRRRHLDGAADRPDRGAQRRLPRGDGQGVRHQLHGPALRRRLRDRDRQRGLLAYGHLGTPASVTAGFQPALWVCAASRCWRPSARSGSAPIAATRCPTRHSRTLRSPPDPADPGRQPRKRVERVAPPCAPGPLPPGRTLLATGRAPRRRGDRGGRGSAAARAPCFLLGVLHSRR